ncbi:hypothetical protein JCM10213v2_008069 [Rhodosporidiobolus nylandii]
MAPITVAAAQDVAVAAFVNEEHNPKVTSYMSCVVAEHNPKVTSYMSCVVA